uniref:Actin n=1 Tax=Arcella intermedia TaxID=1963864 RepID=A0A6B2L7N3_9EUKA|eukprot:TRINITY_DN4232_c1_g2_i1.p1 TRINITY_DN4232_c1_g2~~TRINITY_DN4232_c1_g2_i1.p1  ORF type:complete len:363 (-),score=105.05 TRINITY_DN4232_c1_g2_i1:90-1178(-)
MDEVAAIVVDGGSGYFKAGFAGEDTPRAAFPPVVGLALKGYYVGYDAQEQRDVVSLKHPIKNGLVTQWDNLEKLLHYTYTNELKVHSEDHPVLLSEPPANPKAHREKLSEVMFERFNVPAMYLTIQGILSLYAAGRTTGMILDSGAGASYALAAFEGYSLPHSLVRLDLAGGDLTRFLMRLLKQTPYSSPFLQHPETVRAIKEQLCYIAPYLEDEIQKPPSSLHQTYQLPDGQVITLGSERCLCPEALFRPSLVGYEFLGVQECIYHSIMKADVDYRRFFYKNLVVTGGNTLFAGFVGRIEREVRLFAPPSMSIDVIAPPERKELCWIGGSILASLSTFQQMWISKEEYDESGPYIGIRKCF